MTLLDTGPLVALFNTRDEYHESCLQSLSALKRPLLTTWAVVTEAHHILGVRIGPHAQEALGAFLTAATRIEHLDDGEVRRVWQLMKQYQTTPMDLADATLVVLAEKHDCRCVWTLDSDFHVYRFKGRQAFDLLP